MNKVYSNWVLCLETKNSCKFVNTRLLTKVIALCMGISRVFLLSEANIFLAAT